MDPSLAAIAIAWSVLLGGSAVGALLWLTRFSPQARLRRRLDAIAGQALPADSGPSESRVRRQLIQGKLKELEKERRKNRPSAVRHLILQSGLPLRLRDFIIACAGCGIVLGGILWLAGMPVLAWGLGALAAGVALPRWVLRTIVLRRQRRFMEHFADALDILVRGTRSGLPVAECMRIVAREAPDPVGPEFDFLTEGQRVGMTLKQALARSVDRMPVTELQFFAIVLLIQQQTGGNLASTLENLSNVLRGRKRLRDKVTALSSEARASAMIIGSLPFVVAGALMLINPDYLLLLFTDPLGKVMMALGLAWMGIGTLVMRKMIRFEA